MTTLDQQSRQTRQKRRGADTKDDIDFITEVEEAIEEDEDGGEVTRCVCGIRDYPGAPVPVDESSRNYIPPSDPQSLAQLDPDEDSDGSAFVCCDNCNVWQHGGCVGLMRESEIKAENYFCEECRRDLHQFFKDANGQTYSRFLPFYNRQVSSSKTSSRKSPVRKDSDSTSSRDLESKGSNASALASAKRRSTMNSRAAMDEEEAFRKAIEESRTDGSVAGTVNGSRRGKRARDGSEDRDKQELKRRKTGSDSGSPKEEDPQDYGDESDLDEANGTKSRTSNVARKSRGVAVQSQRDREAREREKERERERAEAAGRRNNRAGRRRVDEPEPIEETSRPSTALKPIPVPRAARTASLNKVPPAAASPPIIPAVSHKKQSKPGIRRGRLGRNQYTRDRDIAADDKAESPRPSHSRDGEEACSTNGDAIVATNGIKPSKPRYMNPSKTSMNDMRKRAAGILEYISRTQVEMATERPITAATQSTTSTVTSMAAPSRPPLARNISVNGTSKLRSEVDGNARPDTADGSVKDKSQVDEKLFRGMSTLQMMDVLTRELVHWQKDYGKWGDR